MIYRRRATPLHSARAAIGCAWCAAWAVVALVISNPVLLGADVVGLLAAGTAAGCGRELIRALRFALPVAVAILVINALVTREGLTVIWRFGDLPLIGQTDVTLEATVYGAILGLRAVALILCGVLYTAAVDPDELLALLRPVSYRSALSATLATRLVPVLARDARRLADAQRCRPGPAPSRVALLRAATSGVLDRALDVAATLEVRGYSVAVTGQAARRSRGRHRAAPISRHDVGFAASAIALVAVAVAGRISGSVGFSAYPQLHAPAGVAVLSAAALLVVCGLAPFADRRGIG